MIDSTASRTLGQVTGPPLVTLVDIDGFAVPVGEKDIPQIDREPQPADSWPAWTDLLTIELGPKDRDLADAAGRMAAALLADRLMTAVERTYGFDAEADQFEDLDGPTEPPDDWRGSDHAGWVLIPPELEDLDATLPPICGGGFEPSEQDRTWAAEAFAEPEAFVPTAEDRAEMHAYRDAIEPMYGYE